MQLFDVACFQLVSKGRCECHYHPDPALLLASDPYYLTARHLTSSSLPKETDEDALDELLTRLCLHGRSDSIGIPGTCTHEPRQPVRQQDLWAVLDETLKASVRFTAQFCPVCNAVLKKQCGHPPLVPAQQVNTGNIFSRISWKLPASAADVYAQICTSFPGAVTGGQAAMMTENSVRELSRSICKGAFVPVAAASDSSFDGKQLFRDADTFASNTGILDAPDQKAVRDMRSLLWQVHQEGMELRDAFVMPPNICTAQDRVEANVERAYFVFSELENRHHGRAMQLARMHGPANQQRRMMLAAFFHVALSTALSGGESDATDGRNILTQDAAIPGMTGTCAMGTLPNGCDGETLRWS